MKLIISTSLLVIHHYHYHHHHHRLYSPGWTLASSLLVTIYKDMTCL